MKKNRLSNKINKALDIPKEVSVNETKVTIISFNEMLVENYKGILEYEEFYIKIKTRYNPKYSLLCLHLLIYFLYHS